MLGDQKLKHIVAQGFIISNDWLLVAGLEESCTLTPQSVLG